jgi:hypothetical protein
VVNRSLRTHGGIYQIDPERGRGYSRGFVVAERFWSLEFAVCNSRRQIGDKDAAFLETPKVLSTAANTREMQRTIHVR